MTVTTPLRKRVFELVGLNHSNGECTGVQVVTAINEEQARIGFEPYMQIWDKADDIEVSCRPFLRDPRSRG